MEGAISIRTWRNEIVVPRDHPAPERVRAEVDATTEHVGAALADGIGAYVARKAGEVILIRDLVFDCDVDLRCDRRELARVLAYRCGVAFVHAVESGASEVVRFASRAALVARFVADMASGCAWGQWYYASFEGVRVLPASVAIRTVLVEDRVTGREALALIPLEAWSAIARTLNTDDAARILDALVEDEEAAFDRASEARWIAALNVVVRSSIPASPRAMALMLYAQWLRTAERGSRTDAFAALTLAAIVTLVRVHASSAIEALQNGDVRKLAQFEPALASVLAPQFVGSQAQALRTLAREAHRTLRASSVRAPGPAADETLPAPFAGLGLLLDEIDALLDESVVAAIPPIEGVAMRGLAALTVIAFAAGSGHARLVWYDASWREFFAIEPSLQWSDFTEALIEARSEVRRQAQDAVSNGAAKHLRGEIVETALRARGTRLHCGVDASNGLWLRLSAHDRNPRIAPSSFRARLCASRRARADWRELDDEVFSELLPLDWLLVFVACAQIALRRLAQRVPGMRNASLPYLRDNLLGSTGESTRLAPDRWRWRMKRPALHVLLALSGIARSEQTWSASPERRVIEWEWV